MNKKKILCPVDFSDGSARAVDKARELSSALATDVELLHAYQLPVMALPDGAVTVSPTFIADMLDRAQKELNKHRDELEQSGVHASTKLVEGSPAEVIAERAKELDTPMIVMGTHGRGGFRRFLLGSVAERVVRTSSSPVLTVHLPEA
jgi:nucleotide-binding universal stress UspA family protein